MWWIKATTHTHTHTRIHMYTLTLTHVLVHQKKCHHFTAPYCSVCVCVCVGCLYVCLMVTFYMSKWYPIWTAKKCIYEPYQTVNNNNNKGKTKIPHKKDSVTVTITDVIVAFVTQCDLAWKTRTYICMRCCCYFNFSSKFHYLLKNLTSQMCPQTEMIFLKPFILSTFHFFLFIFHSLYYSALKLFCCRFFHPSSSACVCV